jgi:alpha-L-rhamnosidase
MRLEAVVPANTTATLVLPSASGKKIVEKGIDISKVKAIGHEGTQGTDIILKVGSGTYTLEYPWVR